LLQDPPWSAVFYIFNISENTVSLLSFIIPLFILKATFNP
jgi:hypothetical protein